MGVPEVGAELDAPWKAFSETPADLGTECPLPSAAQQKAVTRLLDDIRDFVQGLPWPAPDWRSVLLRSRLSYSMEEIQAPGNIAWDQLASVLPPNGRAALLWLVDGLEGPLREQLTSPVGVPLRCKNTLWPPAPPKAKVCDGT